MSRAFIKEVEPETIEQPDRAVSTHPNFVTAEGLAAIERTLSHFETAHKTAIDKTTGQRSWRPNASFDIGTRDDRPQRLLSHQPIKAKYSSGRQ